MKISSWNVNSVKARLDHVKKYLNDSNPDVLFLQELKGVEFPADIFQGLGYQSEAVTQKSYNGVAVLSKLPISVIHKKLPEFEEDEQARYLEIEIQGLRLINIYLPNGNPVPGGKYDYKLKWMGHLKDRLEKLTQQRIPFAIGGDFNVMPEDKDCHAPKDWEGDALIRSETRYAFRSIENLGLYDAFRIFNKAEKNYTFWDYQAGAWPQNKGIRIDHFLLSSDLVDCLERCQIDKEPRGWERPSDHTPIQIKLDL